MVYESGGDRVQILDVEDHQGWPVYVDVKVCIVDDVWAAVGRAPQREPFLPTGDGPQGAGPRS